MNVTSPSLGIRPWPISQAGGERLMELRASDENLNAIRHRYFERLALYNERVVRQCCGPEIWRAIRRLKIIREESQAFAALVQRHVFWRRGTSSTPATSISAMLDADDRASVLALINSDIVRYSAGKDDTIDVLVDSGIAAVLVRPEMYHLRKSVADFLVAAGYQIEYGMTRIIGIEQYLALYNHTIGNPEKEPQVRRRAFGYVNKPLYLWLVTHPYIKDASAADALCNIFKGRAGMPAQDTLRGDVVYREMLTADIRDHELTVLALDPTQELWYADSNQSTPTQNAFLANLAGVHIPDAYEIRKDLCVLLDLEEADAILTRRPVVDQLEIERKN